MRLALVLEQCLAPVPGGTGRYSAELARALVATAVPGDEVSAWTAWHADTRAARVPGGARPHRLPLGRRALASAWQRGAGPAPRRADVVHAPTLLVPPRRGRPLVVTLHDTVPWTHPQTLTARGVAFHRRMAARAARQADLLVVPTQAVAAEVARLLHPRAPVVVVGEGVAPGLALPADAAARAARLRLPPAYLATLATLEPRKGLDVLVAALAAAAAPTLPLVVVGAAGWGGVDPVALARRAGLPPERLHVLGRLADPDVAVTLAGATALVVPSRAEGFGLPVLEGFALGTPVLVSDAPALVEVAGGAAEVTPAGDAEALAGALARVVGDPALRARMVAAGRARADAFSWTRAARALWGHYRRLAAAAA